MRVGSAWGSRTASIDPRAVSEIRAVCGGDQMDITIEANNVDGPVTAAMMPRWTRGPARAYRRPDVFDGARDCYTRLLHVITVLGVFMDQALLEYANGLRKGLFGSPDR